MSEDENSQTGPARKKRGSYSVGRSTRTTIIRGATQLLSMRGYYGFSLPLKPKMVLPAIRSLKNAVQKLRP